MGIRFSAKKYGLPRRLSPARNDSADLKTLLSKGSFSVNIFLQLSSAFDGAKKGYLVGIFKVSANGNAVGKARDLYTKGF